MPRANAQRPAAFAHELEVDCVGKIGAIVRRVDRRQNAILPLLEGVLKDGFGRLGESAPWPSMSRGKNSRREWVYSNARSRARRWSLAISSSRPDAMAMIW